MPPRTVVMGIIMLLVSLISCTSSADGEPGSPPTAVDQPTPMAPTVVITGGPTKPDDENIGQHIFRIKAECESLPHLRFQTGARIQGYPGIVTALHGVIGCQNITAASDSSTLAVDLRILDNLEIIKVDIARDIALLAPRDEAKLKLLEEPIAGLKPIASLPFMDCEQAKIFQVMLWGYPQPYVDLIHREGKVICSPQLKQRIPAKHPQREALSNRGSPQLGISILDVDINAEHGHSGAPLLKTETNEVIGIVIGGLSDTRISNAWAVLWTDIDFEPVESLSGEIDRVMRSPLPGALTAFLGDGITAQPTPATTVTPTNRASIIIGNQFWDETYTLEVDDIELEHSRNAWLVVFLEGNDPLVALPLARTFIRAGWNGPVNMQILHNAPEVAPLIRKIKELLFEKGKANLRAYLFIDNEPTGKFNPNQNGFPGDTLLLLENGQSGRDFTILLDKE